MSPHVTNVITQSKQVGSNISLVIVRLLVVPYVKATIFFKFHATLLRCKLKSVVALTYYHPPQTLSRNKISLLQVEACSSMVRVSYMSSSEGY